MRRNRALAWMGWVIVFAGPQGLRADLNLMGIDQDVPALSSQPIVVAQFFDLRADPGARFSEQIVFDLFGRPATEAEIRFDRDRLRGQLTQAALVHEKLMADEHIDILVDDLFQRLLDRSPSTLERFVYLQFLIHGARESDLAVELLTAEPYASPMIETAPQAWLDDIFRRLAGRDPSAAESDNLFAVYSMNFDLAATVQVIVNSDSVRSRVIADAYEKLLDRSPTPDEIAVRLAEFSGGMREMDLRSRLLLSAEYRDREVLPSYSAVVDWGDGSRSQAVIVENFDGGFVHGEHAYPAAATYVVTTTLVDDLGQTVTVASQLTRRADPRPGMDEVYSVVASYIDGPAETGLLPGETTGEASGAYLEDPTNAVSADGVVAGQLEDSDNSSPQSSSPPMLPCGLGAPLAAGVVAAFCAGGRRRRSRA